MTPDQQNIINDIALAVKDRLKNTEKGHGWWHISRVWQNAQLIAQQESEVSRYVVELAALLHDIADPKFHDGDEEIGPKTATSIMQSHCVDQATIDHVVNIIRYMSFKNSIDGNQWESPELLVVQDADRLDAIGAVGIARALHYGGHKDRTIFDAVIPPIKSLEKEAYKKSSTPTLNHFYEKLLKLTARMNTSTGKALAKQRHDFMVSYLEQFYHEIGMTPQWHKDWKAESLKNC